MKTLFDDELFQVRMIGGPEDGRTLSLSSIHPYIEVAVQRQPMVMLEEGFNRQQGWTVARYRVHRNINGYYEAFYIKSRASGPA